MTKSGLPSFLFVGTAKAGTTSIYNYLLQHPQIEIPQKETFFFIDNASMKTDLSYPKQRKKEELITDIDGYRNVYALSETDTISGEIGTGYLYYHESAIPRIKAALGEDVHICAILRNPVDRAWSAYLHFAKDLHEQLDLHDAIEAEEERINAHWDFMWHYRKLGCYSAQIAAYQKAFKHFKVFLYDDLQQDPSKLMEDLRKFIGADPFTFDTTQKFNRSGKPRYAAIQKLVTHESGFKTLARPVFRAVFSKDRRKTIRKYVRNKNRSTRRELPAELRRQLQAYYLKDIEQLEVLIDRDLSVWKNTVG